MGKINTLFRLLREDRAGLRKAFADNFSNSRLSRIIPDEAFLRFKYKACIGKPLNLENPKTFNEKLNWLKLNDRQDIYTQMVDKHLVKAYVADRIGQQYIIPTLGVWEDVEQIDFDALPNQFVLKWNHDSGSAVICKDKSSFDRQAAALKLKKCKKHNGYWHAREWPYKNVKPCIIAEQYMEDEKTGELRDYKFFCFDGTVRAMFIATERQTAGQEVKFDFFDAEGKHLNVRQGHPNASTTPEIPETFDEMKSLAEKLSYGVPQLRVDFYEVNGRVYFGDLTFSHFAGMVPFEPEQWDAKLGEYIVLPKEENTK